MQTLRKDLILGCLPEAVRPIADRLGTDVDDCRVAVRSDLDLDGRQMEVWLLITGEALVVAVPSRPDAPVLSGPFVIRQIDRTRARQTVGSACLQVQIDGIFTDVIRYNNRHRETFERVRGEINRLLLGQPVREEVLTRPSDRVCGVCSLPLPGIGAQCPRCRGGRGILWRTLKLMMPYLSAILTLLLFMLLGVGLDLLPPLLTRTMVDRVLTPRTNLHWLPLILLGLVGAAAGRCLLNILIGRTSSLIGTRVTRELREQLQRKLMELNVDYYNRHSVGTLMSRVLYDVDYFQSFVAQVAQGFLLNLMLVLGIGSMLFWMNARLALLALLPIPFVVVGTTFFWRHIYPRYYRLWDSQSKMAQMLSGLLSGIRLVKVFGQEERERQRFSVAAHYMRDTRRSLEVSLAVFNPLMGFVFGLGGLIIWYAGGRMVFGDHMTLGTLMAFFGYMGMFYGPVSSLSMFSNWMTGFLSAGQRVFEVLDSAAMLPEPSDPVHPPSLLGAIEFENVSFGYDPYTPILKNVSFTIEPGQFIGIVGKSGSGKTTLVNLICRFYDVQEGSVRIDGIDVRNLSRDDLHHHVGLVLQEPFLFRASIAQNIAYGRPDAGSMAIIDAARAANAHDFIARRESGYDTQLGENGAGLSGGERQRISIARALLCNPRILILDEATSSVDTESEQEIQKALSVLCRGRTTIAIAHRLATLKNADRIFVFDDGRLAESGPHETLMAQQGIYHKLVRIQTELTRLEPSS